MKSWSNALRDGLFSGSAAAIATIAALAASGRRDIGRALAPINAVSHVFWGDEALRENDATLRHTVPGLVVHAGSALLWGVLYEKLVGTREPQPVGRLVRDTAAATAAIAVVDLLLVPQRLTPGFERRLSPSSLLLVYLALGFGLAAGTRAAANPRSIQRAASATPIPR